MRATPEDKRIALVAARQNGATIREAARIVGVLPKVAWRWLHRFRTHGNLAQLKKTGRPKAMSAAAALRAKELLLSEEHHGAKSVARALHSEGLTAKPLHPSTIIRAAVRRAVEDGKPIRAARGKPAKRLTQDTRSKRLKFARDNRRRAWGNVLFTDRKKFLFLYPGCKVKRVEWVEEGSQREAAAVNHPSCVNVYAGISMHGVTACHVVAGTSKHKSTHTNKKGEAARNITASEYKDVLMHTLLPKGSQLFGGKGVDCWVLQQDNDPTHRAAKQIVKHYSKQHGKGVQVLEGWPPNSPDLNPIENVWSWVEAEVHKKGCKTFEAFKQAVLDTIQAVPKAMLANLYASMPKRMAKVIERDGDKTGY